jgi:hypothetical protein
LRSIAIGFGVLNTAPMPVLRPSLLVRRNAAITLLSLLVMLVVSPLTEALPHGSIIVGPFVTVIFVTSIQQAVTHPFARTAFMSTAALWLLLQFRLGGPERPVVESILSSSILLLLCAVTLVLLLKRIFQAEHVDSEVICGALSAYLLIGVAWAQAFRIDANLELNAFKDSTMRDVHHYLSLYFSFATLTTTGFGDVVPLTPFARMLAVTEALSGVFFTATVIARLVALYRPKRAREHTPHKAAESPERIHRHKSGPGR